MTQGALDWTATQDQADRDRGMARATAHANADHRAWSELAYAFLVRYARTTATFAGYELIEAAKTAGAVPERRGSKPTDRSPDKAWGSIFVRAAKAGLIQRVGYAQHPTRHGSPTPRWRSLIYLSDAA